MTDVSDGISPGTRALDRAALWASLIGGGVALLSIETIAPTIEGRIEPSWNVLLAVVGLSITYLMVRGGRYFPRLPWSGPAPTFVLGFAACLATGLIGGVAWPNSGDENSYVFMADTFLAGRFWIPAPDDVGLFQLSHVLVRDGRMFSPYPPGWSIALMPFRAFGVLWLASPLFTLAGGVALFGAMRRVTTKPEAANHLLALALLTPFVAFNGGSMFPHSMTFAVVACITALQLADEAHPKCVRRVVIGGLFGMLLAVRYDVFLVISSLFAIDRIFRRRAGALTDVALMAIGFLPFAWLLLAYNAAVTGDPFQSTATWALSSESAINYPQSIGNWISQANRHDFFWLGELAQYGGFPLLVVGLVGLKAKMVRRELRFYDGFLPAIVVFYSLVPFSGGHQYGPRYWLVAFPFLALTAAGDLHQELDQLRVGSRVVELSRFTAASLVFAMLSLWGLIGTARMYLDERKAILSIATVDQPALVLLPSRLLKTWPWQLDYADAGSDEFTRNGVSLQAPILLGRLDVPDAVGRACRLGGRSVYQWVSRDRVDPLTCPQERSPVSAEPNSSQ